MDAGDYTTQFAGMVYSTTVEPKIRRNDVQSKPLWRFLVKVDDKTITSSKLKDFKDAIPALHLEHRGFVMIDKSVTKMETLVFYPQGESLAINAPMDKNALFSVELAQVVPHGSSVAPKIGYSYQDVKFKWTKNLGKVSVVAFDYASFEFLVNKMNEHGKKEAALEAGGHDFKKGVCI